MVAVMLRRRGDRKEAGGPVLYPLKRSKQYYVRETT